MQAHINHRTLGIVLGGAVAVLFAGGSMVEADPNPPAYSAASAISQSAYQSELSAWASANGLSGLSPAGLAVVPARSVVQSEVAAWATANGLSGLSPAGLAVVPARSVYQSEVTAWATANGLSGLSPASLSRIDD